MSTPHIASDCFSVYKVQPLLADTPIMRTPLYYVQSAWSERDHIPYKLYLYNADTSIMGTLSKLVKITEKVK